MVVPIFRLALLYATKPLYIRLPLLIGHSQPLSISQPLCRHTLDGLAHLYAILGFLPAWVGFPV